RKAARAVPGGFLRPIGAVTVPLPPGHGQTIAVRSALSRRERWMIGGVLAVVAVVAAALAISFASAGRTSSRGCIYATIPGVVGAQEINRCGADARATCASALAPGSFTRQAAVVIAAQCRKAGLRVGR